MTIQVGEFALSRNQATGEDPWQERVYTVEAVGSDYEDDAAVLAAVKSEAPTTVSQDGMTLYRRTIQPESQGGPAWQVTVRYGKVGVPEVGDSIYNWEIGSETIHVTQSLSTPHSYAKSGLTAPDFKGAIGVRKEDGKLSVEGVDIDAGSHRFSETHYLDPAVITTSYKASLVDLRRKVNASSFRGHAAGEVRFMGARGSYKEGDQYAEVTFEFAARKNETGLVCGEITGIAKEGWEYLWVLYDYEEDATAKATVLRPQAVYVEQLFPPGDFSILGIGS